MASPGALLAQVRRLNPKDCATDTTLITSVYNEGRDVLLITIYYGPEFVQMPGLLTLFEEELAGHWARPGVASTADVVLITNFNFLDSVYQAAKADYEVGKRCDVSANVKAMCRRVFSWFPGALEVQYLVTEEMLAGYNPLGYVPPEMILEA